MKKRKSYLIAVPDKKNPNIIRYHRVTGPRFLYGKTIVKECSIDGDEEVRTQITSEVEKIIESPIENIGSVEEGNKKEMKPKRKIRKPKSDSEYFELRYTMPKERSIVARIVNQIKYENGWYDDIEKYLNDEKQWVWDDMEWSKNAEKRKDQRLYKRVQAYEDAEDDIQMQKAFLALKLSAVAAMLVALGLTVNFVGNEVHDMINNSSYVAPTYEKSTLANANSGEIAHAELVISKIDYNFEYLSYNELLDTIIRIGGKPSGITKSRAMGAMKNVVDFEDQKLLDEIIQEAYEEEYDGFDDKKKQELNQLIYEMLDEEIKVWIRSPENVAKLKEKNNTMETVDTGSER